MGATGGMTRMMINIVICDDNIEFSDEIESYVIQYFSKVKTEYLITKYSSGEELLEKASWDSPYNLVFLDIKMNNIDGLDVAQKIHERSSQAMIVFITSYIDFHVASYKANEAGYILKNRDNFKREFNESMDLVIRKFNLDYHAQSYDFQNGSMTVHINDIVYVESRLHEVIFHIKENDNIIRRNLYAKLDDIEKRLPDNSFIRVHKSFLVNLQYVKYVERYVLVLFNDSEISISKNKFSETKDAFHRYRAENEHEGRYK
jgi:DNA-binding LytR/AlgR family response regulator